MRSAFSVQRFVSHRSLLGEVGTKKTAGTRFQILVLASGESPSYLMPLCSARKRRKVQACGRPGALGEVPREHKKTSESHLPKISHMTTRAEDAHGTPTQSHISPSILVCEETGGWGTWMWTSRSTSRMRAHACPHLLFFFFITLERRVE